MEKELNPVLVSFWDLTYQGIVNSSNLPISAKKGGMTLLC